MQIHTGKKKYFANSSSSLNPPPPANPARRRPLSHFGLISFLLPGEAVPECRRYVQVRNITKGDCRLDNVEVSFCRGRCLSRTDVTLEVCS